MKKYLSKIGGMLLLYGLISIFIYIIGYNISIMMWMDSMGNMIGFLIRGAFVSIGALLYILGIGTIDAGSK